MSSSPDRVRAVFSTLLPAVCRAVRMEPMDAVNNRWWGGPDAAVVRARAEKALEGAWFPGAEERAGAWLTMAVDWLDAHPERS